MDLLADLTDPQREAVTQVEGPLLVIAGAGSGKTRVITRRVAWLLAQGVEPSAVLAITFTNKAAGEMRSRIVDLVGEAGVWVSTFHALGARLLRRHGEVLGLNPDFSIYDSQDKLALIKDALRDLQVSSETFKPPALAQHISGQKQLLRDPEASAQAAYSHYEEVAARVYRRYQEGLNAAAALDFDDLLTKLVRLLLDHPDVRERLQARFRYLLVDEYQDTNHPQYVIANQLAAGRRNICVTGDPDQSIYAWRGADIGNILSFEADYPEARVVLLEQNYRSTQTILQAAQAVISQNLRRKEKALWTQNDVGRPLGVVRAASEREEARRAVELVADALGRGMGPEDMAIFYRVNALSRSLEAAFLERDIPYQVVGGVAFYQRKEIKDLLAYLRLAANPRDDVSFQRVVNVPSRKLGKASVEKLRGLALERGCGLFDAAADPAVRAELGRCQSALAGFLAAVERVRAAGPQGPVAALEAALEATAYRQYLRALDEHGQERDQNVDELLAAAEAFRRAHPQATLQEFLADVALVSDVDGWDQEAARVSLMTLHSAKGLEFALVIIVGLEEGLLPHALCADEPDELEEERRLFYVGITRAKRELYLLSAQTRMRHGGVENPLPSRFLRELPEDIIGAPPTSRVEPRGGVPLAGPEALGRDDLPFAPGDRVRHAYFGPGRVIDLSGSGPRRRIRIAFPGHGEKQFVLQYAQLTADG